VARSKPAPETSNVATRSTIPIESTGSRQRLPVTLIGCLLVSQLFDYKALDFPASKLVFTVTPDRLLFALLFVRFGPSLLSHRDRPRPSGHGEVYIMALFGLLCTVSWLSTGLDFGAERYRWLTTLCNLVYFPFGLYLIVRNTTYDRQAVRRLLVVIVGIGSYLGFTGLFEHYQVSWLVWPRYILDPTTGIQFGRVRGPFASSVGMGEWLIVTFIFASLLGQFVGSFTAWYLSGLSAIAVAGIYFTNTRGVWLSFAGMVLSGICFGGKLRGRLLGIAALVSIAFLLGVGSKFAFGQKTLFSRRDETINYRLANYSTDYKMGMDNLLTGVGYGSFRSEWSKYFGAEERKLVRDLTDGNHNTYLGLFAETGIFGLLLYVSLLVALAGKCIGAWRNHRVGDDFEKGFAVATLGLVCVTMIEGVFGDQRFDPTLNVMLFLCVGIVASMPGKEAIWQHARR
jgi:O-antigen ligase